MVGDGARLDRSADGEQAAPESKRRRPSTVHHSTGNRPRTGGEQAAEDHGHGLGVAGQRLRRRLLLQRDGVAHARIRHLLDGGRQVAHLTRIQRLHLKREGRAEGGQDRAGLMRVVRRKDAQLVCAEAQVAAAGAAAAASPLARLQRATQGQQAGQQQCIAAAGHKLFASSAPPHSWATAHPAR